MSNLSFPKSSFAVFSNSASSKSSVGSKLKLIVIVFRGCEPGLLGMAVEAASDFSDFSGFSGVLGRQRYLVMAISGRGSSCGDESRWVGRAGFKAQPAHRNWPELCRRANCTLRWMARFCTASCRRQTSPPAEAASSPGGLSVKLHLSPPAGMEPTNLISSHRRSGGHEYTRPEWLFFLSDVHKKRRKA
jgi:hypothetical protein